MRGRLSLSAEKEREALEEEAVVSLSLALSHLTQLLLLTAEEREGEVVVQLFSPGTSFSFSFLPFTNFPTFYSTFPPLQAST